MHTIIRLAKLKSAICNYLNTVTNCSNGITFLYMVVVPIALTVLNTLLIHTVHTLTGMNRDNKIML